MEIQVKRLPILLHDLKNGTVKFGTTKEDWSEEKKASLLSTITKNQPIGLIHVYPVNGALVCTGEGESRLRVLSDLFGSDRIGYNYVIGDYLDTYFYSDGDSFLRNNVVRLNLFFDTFAFLSQLSLICDYYKQEKKEGYEEIFKNLNKLNTLFTDYVVPFAVLPVS